MQLIQQTYYLIQVKLPYWTQKFDHCAFKINHNQNKPRLHIQEVRVIIHFLKGEPHETIREIEKIEKGQTNWDNNISILCRKERELKKTGRMFCEQTYKQRLVQTACESNINKHIFP